MKKCRTLKLLSLFIILIFLSLTGATTARAALQVSFSSQPSPAELSVGEAGTWTVTVSNPDPDEVTNVTLTVSLPGDYTVTGAGGGTESPGPPHTLTWTIPTISGNGGESVQTFQARPDCGAASGGLMRAEIAGGASAQSDQITVKTPVISVKLVDDNGNTVHHASVGDQVSWTMTIDNSGTGDTVHGTVVTFDLGSALSYDTSAGNPISTSTGHDLPVPQPSPGQQQVVWNSGIIQAGTQAVYEIKTVVTGCDRNGLANNVEVSWSDDGSGQGAPCGNPVTTLSSIALELNEPDISISVSDPGQIAYCPGNSTPATISITNSGSGPATDFKLELSHWPADWTVNVTSPATEVSFDETTATFSLTDDIDPGATFDLTFTIEPDNSCNTTSEARILFLPDYYNQCGPTDGTHYTTPVIGPETWTIEPREIPTLTIQKSGPATANLGDTGLVYNITVTYSGPNSVLPQTVDVVDTYPDEFTVENPGGGVDDSAAGTVTWSNVQFDTSNKTRSFTVTMSGPAADDHCAAFQRYCDEVSLILQTPNTFVDCRGCPGVIDTDRARFCTFIEDTQTAVIDSSHISTTSPDPADVCTTLNFETCYKFVQSATATTWSGITLNNTMDTGSSSFSNPTVTAIKVNGIDFTSDYSGTPLFSLNLSYLDNTAAAKPSDGAEICVTYTWEVGNYEGAGFNHSTLEVPWGGSGCDGSQAYDVGRDFSVVGTHLVLHPVSPDLVKACQDEEFTIVLSEPEDQFLGRVFYDAEILLDPRGNYSFDPNGPIQAINLVDTNGNPPAISITDNSDGTYTIKLGDVRVGNTGLANRGVVKIIMRHSCDENHGDDWSVKGYYHNHCENDDGTIALRETAEVESEPLRVLYGRPFLMLVPATIFAATPYPEATVYIVNGGPAPIKGACLTINLGTGIEYIDHTPDTGSGNGAPDSDDVTTDTHNVKFHYNEIASGALVKLGLKFKLLSCTGHNITASLKWCDNATCDDADACGPKVKISTVDLPKSQVVVISHTGGKLDYCNDQPADFAITAANNDQADAFNLRIVELLPPGVTYDPNNVVFTYSAGSLNVSKIVETVVPDYNSSGRQQVTWDFSSALPDNGDGDPAMAPSSELKVEFKVQIEDCAAAKKYRDAADKSAEATVYFDPPCNFTGSDPPKSNAKLLSTAAFTPHLTIDKKGYNLTRNPSSQPWEDSLIGADANDVIQWRITYHNDGDYVAKAVTVADTLLPAGLVGSVYDSTLDGNTIADDWITGRDIGTVDPGQTRTILFKTQVLNQCSTSTGTNTATVEYGCCSEAPMHQTASDALDLTISPDFDDAGGQVHITHEFNGNLGQLWPVCGGTVVITLTNSGGSAVNEKVTATLDSHYEVVPGSCTISSSDSGHSFTPPTLVPGSDTVEFLSANIDKVFPGETITIKFDAKVRTDAGACSVPPGSITNNVSFEFTDNCSTTFPPATDSDNFNPRRPDLSLAVDPVQQVVEEGDPVSWQITVHNSGYRADDVVLTVDLGNGFLNPGDDQTGGSWSGTTGTWNISSIGNSDWVVNVNATVFDTTAGETAGSLANHIKVISHCGGASGCILNYPEIDAYTTAFSLEKTVDKADANVGELLTYDVKAVFSNTDTFTGTEIVDTLPGYVDYISATPQSDSDFNQTPVQSGSTLTWSPADFQGRKVFHYLIEARIRNDAGLAGGQELINTIFSRFKVDYGSGQLSSDFSLSRSASTTIHEPKLGLSKTISPNSNLQAGDTVTITLVAENTGDGPAYNVSLNDLINDNNAKSNGIPDGVVDGNDVIVYNCNSITAATTPADFSYTVSGTAPACRINYKIIGDNAIPPGTSRTFSFTVQIAPTMVTGSNFTNQAETKGWSLKPSDAETENPVYDRSPDTQATDEIISESVTTDGKSLTSTSEPSTANNRVAIGEVAEYQLRFTFPAGETRAVTLRDRIPLGLGYIAGSATLDRDDSNLTTANDPGGINTSTPGTPVAVTLNQSTNKRLLSLSLGTVTNNSGQTAHFILTLKCVARNSSNNNAGRRLRDRIQMIWRDAAGTRYTTSGNRVTVRVVEPVPAIVKTATPTTAEGGDTITFTIKLCNNASGNSAASAFDWVFTDPLPADYENPQVTNIDTGSTGATVTASFTSNDLLKGTIDQLDPGECVTVTYTADIIARVDFGKTITNTAQFMTTSLPGDYGTGGAAPGEPGSDDGERTGSGVDSNDLRGSDSALVTTNTPNITKVIITPQTWYAIGDEETFKLTLGIPTGVTSKFVVTDTLPEGLVYIDNSQSVTPPAGFDSINDPPTFTWDPATRELKWDFGDVKKASPPGDLIITYDVKVENVLTNQDGTTLTNRAVLTFGPGSNNTIIALPQTMTVGEPDLYLEKTPQTTPVDLQAGNTLRYRVEFWNNGHTTAYQMDWKDVLPNLGPDNGLYLITNPALTIVSGDVYQNNTTTPLTFGDLVISTTNGPAGNNDTIALPAFSMAPGSHFQVEFDCQLMPLVVAGETLTNETAVSYRSRVSGDRTTGVRDCETPPCNDDDDSVLNNYGESASHDLTVKAEIDIVKTLVGGTDKFTIGEEFAYNLRTWVIEGVSPDVEVHDDIPAGLTLVSHQINTPGIGIISFSNPNYDTPSGNVIFDFGNVTNADNNDPTDDHFDVELTVKVDNIAANQDGVTITNNAFVRWTAGVDKHSQDVDIEIIEPVLSVSKTVSPTIQAVGDLVTYTVVVDHAAASTDNAYDLMVKDTLPAGLTFISSTEPNTGSGQNLEFHKASLLQSEYWQFTYTVRVDTSAAGTLTNALELDWSSIPGADGSTHSGRNGNDCGQAAPLNDYCEADNASLQVVKPEVEIQKTVYLGHDSGASCPGDELATGVHGKEITYCFTVTNTGDTYLNSLTIADSDIGITEADLTLKSGTTPLAPGQSLVYYYDDNNTLTINGDLTNTAGVSATPTNSSGTPISGASKVTDTDTARVDEIAPKIKIDKTVYLGHDGGTTYPGSELAAGASGTLITYLFTVTNTGDTRLDEITINDPDLNFGVNDPTLRPGDSLYLIPGATSVYYYETTITKDLTNTATASGNPTDLTGADLPQVPKPRDSDTARVTIAQPNIDIQKTVYRGHNGGASCPGGELLVGENGAPVTYCFVVTNTGDTYLDDITIDDADLNLNISNLRLLSGTLPLAPSANVTYYYEATITRNLTNTATASGNPTDAGGIDLPGLTEPTDSDTAQVIQVGPGIEIQKTVYSGHDGGASCPGSELVTDINGAPITYCFVVTNTGDTYLTEVTLTDASLSINNITLTPGPLAPNASVSYHKETTITGDLTNTASTTGHPADAGGNILPDVPAPTDSDTASVDQIAPGIDIQKTVYLGHNGGTSCPGIESVSGTNGTQVTYCFKVTNTGGTYLNNVTLKDMQLGLDVTLSTTPLAPNGTLTYHFETVINGDLTNTATASGHPSDASGIPLPGLPDPTDTDTASVDQVGPGIDIQKTVYLGHDGGASCAGAIEHVIGGSGAPVTYCFTVTNTGDTYLNDITIDDDDLGIKITDLTLKRGRQPLPPGDNLVYYYESTISKNLLNTARTEANPTDSSGHNLPGVPNPSATDTAQVEVAVPGLTLVKTVYQGHDHGGSCPGADELYAVLNSGITYCFRVTNTGNTFLDKITLEDKLLGITEADITLLSGTLPLAPDSTIAYYYETTATGNIINTAHACATPTDAFGTAVPSVNKPCSSATATVYISNTCIPTLNEWGMILLLFMSGFISIYYMRKHKHI